MSDNDFKVKIRTLTPLWTGGVEGKPDRLYETGIIGSMRWWYEALIRGLDGTACDPTSDKKEERCPDKNENHCDACELFGCTGWARKFRLEVEFNNTIPDVWIGTREKRKIRNKEQYLKRNVAGLMSNGTINFKFIPLREVTLNEWALLNKTLNIIEKYGALGAHTSQGNGVIKIIENELLQQDRNPEKSKLRKSGNGIKLPNLNNFFFYKFHIKFKKDISTLIDEKVFWRTYHFLPIAFHIRDAIRHLEGDRNKRHNIFGVGGRNAQGSRIFVSHCYKIDDKTVEARVWGYDVDNTLQNSIKSNLNSQLKQKLFSKKECKDRLENCSLAEEKTGKEILKELK